MTAAYCTKQNMIDCFSADELIQRTDRTGLGVINDTVLTKVITIATAEINSYLAGAYPLPLSSIPENLERVACDIARYYLYDDSIVDMVEKRYDMAIAWLKLVASGKISLGMTIAGDVLASANNASFASESLVFSRANSKGFL